MNIDSFNHLEKYVKDYDETGLKDAEDFEKMDIIFSNINHLP